MLHSHIRVTALLQNCVCASVRLSEISEQPIQNASSIEPPTTRAFHREAAISRLLPSCWGSRALVVVAWQYTHNPHRRCCCPLSFIPWLFTHSVSSWIVVGALVVTRAIMSWKAGLSRYLPAMRFFACPESPSSNGVRYVVSVQIHTDMPCIDYWEAVPLLFTQ